MLKLGKLPARPGAVQFQFSTYFRAGKLPTPPAIFGDFYKIAAWGMLANDSVGDCVLAGGAHETMLFRAEGAEAPAIFRDSDVLSDYTAITGYDPSDPSTDQGTDMEAAAAYRRKTGLIDSQGHRHTVDAYVALHPGNLDMLANAVYLLGAAGVGIQFPGSAMDQFNAGQPWDVVPGAEVDGGHYVPCVGRNGQGNFLVVTWGKLQEVTPKFFATYMDEGVAYVSLERMRDAKSPQGFDEAALLVDLKSLQG